MIATPGRGSCRHLLEYLRQKAVFFEEVARKEAIRPWLTPNGELKIDRDASRLTPDVVRWLPSGPPVDCRLLLRYWLFAEVVKTGPKLFRPTLAQGLAMEQVAPRIPLANYAQPYPVMLIELPDGYRPGHTCKTPDVFRRQSGIETDAPFAILIGTPPSAAPVILMSVLFDSKRTESLAIVPTDATIEDGLVREFGSASCRLADHLPQERGVVTVSAIRLAVTSMLLMMEFGCKRQGPANEGHYQRLQRHAQLSQQRQRGVAEAQRNLRLAPQLYGLEQEIILHERARADRGPARDAVEGTRHPHWRRGHWTMQPHGPGRALRKRLLIKPLLVNGHLLCGAEGAALTVYRVR